MGRMDFRPKDPPAPLPNVEAEGAQPHSAKKWKATTATTSSASKKKTDTPSLKSTKKLEKEKSVKLK